MVYFVFTICILSKKSRKLYDFVRRSINRIDEQFYHEDVSITFLAFAIDFCLVGVRLANILGISMIESNQHL